jgi:hypothetical protein
MRAVLFFLCVYTCALSYGSRKGAAKLCEARLLMTTAFQEAIDRTQRIPDAHEWLWYGTPMSQQEGNTLTMWTMVMVEGGPGEMVTLFDTHSADPMSATFYHYKHPNYLGLLRWSLDETVQKYPHFQLPDDLAVDRAYLNYIEYKEKRFEVGFDDKLDVRNICIAAADAAGWFFWEDKFSLVQRYLDIMELHECKSDFTSYTIGKPQDLTLVMRKSTQQQRDYFEHVEGRPTWDEDVIAYFANLIERRTTDL